MSIRWPALYRPGQLARHGGTLLAWMLLRAGAQAITVILLARTLAPHTYGEFVAVIAVAGFATPLAGLGLANMVLRNAARDPAAAQWYLNRARRVWAYTLLPAAAISFCLALALIPGTLPALAMGAAICGELIATSLTELAGRYRQAQHRPHAYGAINAGLPWLRLLALGALLLTAGPVSITAILWTYAMASMAYVLVLWPVLMSTHAGSQQATEPMPITSGLPFSASALAMRLQTEFNKPILAQGGFGLAGSFNVAQRAVDLVSLPLLALQEALWPRLYAQAKPIPQLRRTGSALLLLAATLGAGIWLTAPLLPLVVGDAHESSIHVLRMLAWLPMFQVTRSLLNFHAIHHGHTHHISWASLLGACIGIGAVVMFVPSHGMAGAAIASYISEITMSFFLLIAALRRMS